jgi:hypothetical protein
MMIPPPSQVSPKTSFGNYGNPKSHIPLGYGTGQTSPKTPQPGNPPAMIVLHLTPAAGSWQAPPEKRLARLLETIVRAYGWRCVGCWPVAPAPAPSVPRE